MILIVEGRTWRRLDDPRIVFAHHLDELSAHPPMVELGSNGDQPLQIDNVFAAKEEELEDRQRFGGEERNGLPVHVSNDSGASRFPGKGNARGDRREAAAG